MAPISATWIQLASSPRLQRSSQALSVLASRAYIFGGELLPRQPVDNQLDVVELHPNGGESAVSKTLPASSKSPSPRVGSPSTATHDALYLFSGRGGLSMMPIAENGALWCYTPARDTWDLIEPADPSAPFPAGRSYHCIASDGSINNTIFVHAGCPETGRLSDLWAFDIGSRAWTELPAAPPPARGGASVAFLDGRLYRMNGFDGETEQGGALDVYDTDARAWSTVMFRPDGVDGPEPRSVSALVAVKVRARGYLVTMFGERDPSALGHAGAGKMLADVWAFDVLEQKWEKVETRGDGPAPRGWFDADVVRDDGDEDAIIVHGGLAEDNSRLGDVWKLHVF